MTDLAGVSDSQCDQATDAESAPPGFISRSAMVWARLRASAYHEDESRDGVTQPPLTMTPTEVARELQISERSFRRHVQAGKIGPAPHDVGDAVRYLRDEVTRWIQAGMPPRATWLDLNREIAPMLRRASAAQNNGRRGAPTV